MTKIAGMLNIGLNNIADYLLYIEQAVMIAQKRGETRGVSDMGDFNIDYRYFEVGGKNKGLNQIAQSTDEFVVKVDVKCEYLKVIPLWLFGLMY